MFKKVFIGLLFCLFFQSSVGISIEIAAASVSAEKPVNFRELLSKAGDLERKGEWNQSEIVFLKAAQSPIPENRIQAYEGLTALYTKIKLPKKAEKTQKLLDEEKHFLARLIPAEDSFYKKYTLQKGDTYAKISKREGISLEWLKRVNHYEKLKEGKEIKVPVSKYTIRVLKDKKVLEWWRENELLKTYTVAVGKKETGTPDGEFKIVTKAKDPIWYHMKVVIPAGSPDNMLGTRWLGLNQKGYGIHGTRFPGNLGKAVSKGCVRMHNRDVEELFEWIPVGTTVSILDEQKQPPQ